MRDFSSFDIMLLHFKLQTSIIMPAEFSIKIITCVLSIDFFYLRAKHSIYTVIITVYLG